MPADYRNLARLALARANDGLQSGAPERLRYAALELRMAMEALTYDRAQAFAAEIPPAEYATWQPKKLMDLLLSIEPHADENSTIRYQRNTHPDEPDQPVRTLGSETVLNLAALKKHYDALGSFLHTPTLRQLSEGQGFDETKVRARCETIASLVQGALASRIFNITLGTFSPMSCGKCGNMMRKRMPSGVSEVEVNCFHCGAGYQLTSVDASTVNWMPRQQELPCPTSGCSGTQVIWDSEIAIGTKWTCQECGVRFNIGYGFFEEKVA